MVARQRIVVETDVALILNTALSQMFGLPSFGSFVHHMHHETSLLQLKMLARLQLLIKFIQWMLLGVHKEKAAIK